MALTKWAVLLHSGRQLDGLARDHEYAFAEMVNRPRIFL
jgi:hypothetical protein